MNYFRPQKLDDALEWLDQHQAGIVAGCTDLLAATASQYLQIDDREKLLDITNIESLRTISQNDNEIRIGATTTWREISQTNLPAAFDGLKAAALEIGSLQIQHSGTIGGNLCNASPAADGVPPLLILDAKVELASSTGTRTLPLQDFIAGPRQTALQQNELLSAIIVPRESTKGSSSFIKLGARKYMIISIAMVAARMLVEENIISEIAVSVGSCSAVATRLPGVEAMLRGSNISQHQPCIISEKSLVQDLSPIADIRADAPYRMKAAAQLVSRTLQQLLDQAGDSA